MEIVHSILQTMRVPVVLASCSIIAHAATVNIIDLGYNVHQGSLEQTQSGFQYVNFTNVRYGAPPTGNDRFLPPGDPIANSTRQTAGNVQIQCSQAVAGWENYVGVDVGNLTQMPPVSEADLSPPAPGESEDCLFLDVLVPEATFRTRNEIKIPVILYIHGGGYAEGSKTAYGPGVSSGIGLLEAAAQDGKAVIYAAFNYRLGAFGFLAGEQVPSTSINLGLQDQIFALRWINRYIGLFGGDPEQVVLMGQSAGAGAILNHINSPDTTVRQLFHAAILQSPWSLDIPSSVQNETYDRILQAANVTSFAQLKDLPARNLQTANKLVVANAQPYGTFAFGPVSNDKRQQQELKHLIFGHTANEGALFASPFVKNDSSLSSYVAALFPSISSSAVRSITDDLYPNDFNESQGYVDQQGRLAKIYGDATVVCNFYALSQTYSGDGIFAYQFSVPPAWHSGDLPYNFWDRSLPTTDVNTTLAAIMQRYLVNFALDGSPNTNATESTEWSPFHADGGAIVQNLNTTGIGPIKQDVNSKTEVRCEWWQKNLSP